MPISLKKYRKKALELYQKLKSWFSVHRKDFIDQTTGLDMGCIARSLGCEKGESSSLTDFPVLYLKVKVDSKEKPELSNFSGLYAH